MTDYEIEEQFILFLEENNCKDKYFKNNKSDYAFEKYEILLKCESYDNLIIDSFSWMSSPEGVEYWEKLNDKWTRIYEDYIDNNMKYYKSNIWND
jgi:hypothetical protein